MSQNASAPFWIRAVVVTLLCAAVVPVWLYAAGWVLSLVLFHGHSATPAVTTWWDYYSAYHATPTMQRPFFWSGGIATALVLSPMILFFTRPKPPLHGDARFATTLEVRRAGLLTNQGDGIIVGKRGNDYLVCGKDGFPHVMLAAPTGSGKGVGVVIPNLFNWNHSVIVLDIKKENWQLTAGFRKDHGHDVFLFDPASPHRITHRWNPLSYVSDDVALRVDEIQSIGNILFPDIQGTDPIWTASCRSLFLGIVLYLFETDGKLRSLGQVGREVMSGKDKRFQKILDDAAAACKPYSDACANTITDYLNTSDNTRTSIRKTFTSRFELFVNPVIDAATSENDFDLTALRKRPISIYLGITPNNLGRLAPLLNLFFQQVVDLNTRVLPEHDPALTRQCLLLLDEFRSLGKMQTIVDGVAFLRGYGVRLLPIFQSPTQISEVYGQDAADTFFDNFNARIVYTPTNQKAADAISRELGTFTYRATSKSKPLGFGKGSSSQSQSDQSRALLLPQEVKEIGRDEAMIFALGLKPVRATKIRWFKDRTFKDRVRPAPVVDPAPLPTPTPIIDTSEFVPVTAADIETIYDRPLKDFNLNFTDVSVPKHELSTEEAEALADQICAGMRR